MSGRHGPAIPFADHFSDRAGDYLRHRPRYPPALVEALAEAAPATGLAWDAGAGSGQLSVVLARRFERVLATDASAEQIAKAISHPRITYRTALSSESGLPPRSADLAVAAQAAHWFALGPYFAEVTRVARRGAVIALVSYATAQIDGAAGEVVERFYQNALGPHWPPERRHVEDGYRGLPFPFRELPAPRLEMREEWTLADLLGYVETWSAVAVLERRAGRGPFEAFRTELSEVWGEPSLERTIRWRLGIRLGAV